MARSNKLTSTKIPARIALPILFLLFCSSGTASAQFIDLPTTKIIIALPIVTYTKTLPEKQISESSKLDAVNESEQMMAGFAADASVFFNEKLALSFQFELNLHQETQSLLFLGGGGGLTWYFVGGANMEHFDSFMQKITYPKYSLFGTFGLASRQYDFSAVRAKKAGTNSQNDQGQSTPQPADPRDPATGSFFGFMAGLGGEYPIGANLLPGLRFQYINAFAGDNKPKFTMTEIWLSVGFIL